MSMKLWPVAVATALLSVSALAQEAKPAAPPFDAEIVCRKIKETGSLVRTKKLCFTQSEWDQIAEVERRGVTRLVDELASKPGGT